MIHADNRVEALPHPSSKQAVGGQGARYVHTRRPQDFHCWAYQIDLLPPDFPRLAGMGVQPGDGETRVGAAEVPGQGLFSDTDRPQEALEGQGRRDPGDRQVDGRQGDAQIGRRQHHDGAPFASERRACRQLAKEFGVPGMSEPGGLQDGL